MVDTNEQMGKYFCKFLSLLNIKQKWSYVVLDPKPSVVRSARAYLRGGGVQGVQNPPPKFSDFFFEK